MECKYTGMDSNLSGVYRTGVRCVQDLATTHKMYTTPDKIYTTLHQSKNSTNEML